jgi:cell division septation protein DedD
MTGLRPEPDEFHDDEEDNYAPRSIFAAGWFRAVLVLTVLAIVVVVALPYLLNWFEPAPAPVRPAAPPIQSPARASSSPTSSPGLGPAPAAPTPPRPLPAVPVARVGESAPSAERVAAVSAKTRSTAARRGSYWVQLGLFKDADNAARLAKKLRGEGVDVQLASVTRSAGGDGGSRAIYHVVQAGAFPDRQRAIAARDDLQGRGYSGFVTEGAGK